MQGGNRGGKGFARETTRNHPDASSSISGITKDSPVPYTEVSTSYVDQGRGTPPVSGTSNRGREVAQQQVMSPKEAIMSQTDELRELKAQLESMQNQYSTLMNAMNSLSIRSGVHDMQSSSQIDMVQRPKEADKLVLPKFIEKEPYDAWRTATLMYLPSACALPQECENYLDRLEDEDDDLADVPPGLVLFDRKLRASLLTVFDRTTEQGRRIILYARTKRDLTGLQLFRFVDKDFNYKHGRTQVDYIFRTIETLCPSEEQFGEFLTNWKSNVSMLEGSEDELSERMKSSLLCKKIEHLDLTKAVVQQWKSNKVRNYQSLVDALDEMDAERRHDLQAKKLKRISARAAKASVSSSNRFAGNPASRAGPSKDRFSGSQCNFCKENRKGSPTAHTDQSCWFNPKSKAFAPKKKAVRDFLDKNKHLISDKSEGRYEIVPTTSRIPNTGLESEFSTEKKKALAAQLLSNKDILDYILELAPAGSSEAKHTA
jgi:hypothetical protein